MFQDFKAATSLRISRGSRKLLKMLLMCTCVGALCGAPARLVHRTKATDAVHRVGAGQNKKTTSS